MSTMRSSLPKTKNAAKSEINDICLKHDFSPESL